MQQQARPLKNAPNVGIKNSGHSHRVVEINSMKTQTPENRSRPIVQNQLFFAVPVKPNSNISIVAMNQNQTTNLVSQPKKSSQLISNGL